MTRQLFRHHPVVGHTFVPGLRTRVEHEAGGYLVRTNAAGFRCDHELVPERAPGTYRVLLFGDSFTAGDGVSNGRRWGDLLEALCPGVHVDNLALPGTGTDQQYLTYRTFAAGVEADLLVVAVYLDDAVRNMEQAHRWATPGGREQWLAKPWFELGDDRSLTLHGTPVPVRPLPRDRRPAPPEVDAAGAFDASGGPAWRLLEAILREWAEAAALPMLVVPIPLTGHIEGELPPQGYQARFAGLGALPGISVHDPLGAFASVGPHERAGLRFAHDPHLTAAGHRVLAQSLTGAVEAMRGPARQRPAAPARRATEGRSHRPVAVLGISGYYHDAAAAIVRDGRVVAAAEEERFSRLKHDAGFPSQAVNFCLGEAQVEAEELDAAVFYDDPVLTLDRVVSAVAAVAAQGGDGAREQWASAARGLGTKPFVAERIQACIGSDAPVLVARHHASHMASAFFPSPFAEAAVLTVDGVGEWATTGIGRGAGADLQVIEELVYPHSLGLLYSAFTALCGFAVNDGEYKLMGLAPYGEPRFADTIRSELLDLGADGSFALRPAAAAWLRCTSMTDGALHGLFGPPRPADAPITRRERDLAASVQRVTEELVLGLARRATEVAGSHDLALAGGVALNCVANGVLLRSGIVDRLWVQPAAGDAGGALGAALLASHQHFGVPRALAHRPPGLRRGRPRTGAVAGVVAGADAGGPADGQRASLLGPAFSGEEVRAFLDRGGHPYEVVPDRRDRARRVARALAEGRIVGVLSGPMEFGPRALGGRSLLGDARRIETQSRMNLAVKKRESFRPFAPAVLAERAGEWFDLEAESPYMLVVAPVRGVHRRAGGDPSRARTAGEAAGEGSGGGAPAGEDLFEIVRRVRSDVPAVTHVDFSARVQTVGPGEHPELRAVLEAFEELTGCPMVVNTSFNAANEPIVCSPQDAYRCFRAIGADLLVLEDCIVDAALQAPVATLPFTMRAAAPPPDREGEELLERFFAEHLAPAAGSLGRRGVDPLAPSDTPDDRGTFFTKPAPGPTLSRDPAGTSWSHRLAERWNERDLPELAGLVDPLVELAVRLRPSGTVDRSPSPTAYVMW